MGKFDGILLCSDWDGTLFVRDKIPPANIDAIKYFQDNGGTFTVCTGRDLPYMRAFFDKVMPNTHLIALNGAKIIDPDTEEKLYEGFLDEKLFDILDEIFTDASCFTDMCVYFEGSSSSVYFYPDEYARLGRRLFPERVYKVLLYGVDENKVLAEKSRAEALGINDYVFVRSWKNSLEILKKENAKGAAVKRLSEHIGAKRIITVGDFENDILMIEAADIGYAVGDATDALKAVADRVTVPAAEGAIARIIEDIEREL